MEEIIEDYEQGGREESGYVVMDVRGKLGDYLSNSKVQLDKSILLWKLRREEA